MITGVGALGLLAVLVVAIRVGERAAMLTALLAVLALNFFFVEPRHTLTIADEEDVVALIVFLIAAGVVGRLAARVEDRAELAAAREREAKVLAGAASALLEEGVALDAQLARLGASLSAATGGELELGLTSAPAPDESQRPVRLPTETRPAWVYAKRDSGWDAAGLERIAAPLARLIDFARDRERARAEAAEADASKRADVTKTALLHAISHDLRSPLTAITTAAGGLRSADLPPADRAALQDVIEIESERLARLVDDLLDLSKIQAGAVNPRPDWCDLRDTALRAAAHVRGRHADHPIEFDLPEGLPLVQADAAQLERVLSNLIENAVKFSPPGEPVLVSGGGTPGRVIVRVSDRGRGIPHSKQAQVFEPFFRGRDGDTGSGLGLAICRGLVEANGGRIELQSAPGQGTSFAVSFPAARQPAGLP